MNNRISKTISLASSILIGLLLMTVVNQIWLRPPARTGPRRVAARIHADTPPEARNVHITPTVPVATDDLYITYVYTDADGNAEGDTEIRWERDGQYEPFAFNQNVMTHAHTYLGEMWCAEVTPCDVTLACGVPVSDCVIITSPPPVCEPALSSVNLTGPPAGKPHALLTFTATAVPPDATPPITYIWSSDGLVSGQGLSQTTYRWDITGTQNVQVTARNCGAQDFSASHSVVLTETVSGDRYEDDDVCTRAAAIPTDGTVQTHTFHTHGDADWITFDAVAKTPYIVRATHVSTAADPVLELYAQCTGDPSQVVTPTFGDVALRFTAPASGPIYARLYNHEATTYGPGVTYALTVHALATRTYAILLGGRQTPSGPYMDDINYSLALAYRVFKDTGLTHDDIFLLHPDPGFDADGDSIPDVDALPTLATIEDAITTWAAERVRSGTPLYLYFIDHGDWDRFYADVGVELLSTDLDAWLSTLEQATGADQITLIIEACHSGSFIAYPGSLSQDGRVIITSTSNRCRAFVDGNGGGAAFSNVFLSQLGATINLEKAFHVSMAAVRSYSDLNCNGHQAPWLDDNGDKQYDQHDGAVARLRILGTSNPLAPVVEIDTVAHTPVVNSSTTITATVYVKNSDLDWVWAKIIPPSAQTNTEDTLVPIEGTEIRLTATAGHQIYHATYGGFTEIGQYRIIIYARTKNGYQAVPKHFEISTGQHIYLPLVLRQ